VLLPERIETPRLLLRKPLIEDAHEIYRNYARDPEVTRFLTWSPHDHIEESFDVMISRLAHWEQGTEFSWCLNPRGGSGSVMGMISAGPDPRAAWRWSVGYVLGKPWWDQGFMTEAVSAVIATLFDQPGIARVWAYVDEENYASARVLEKAGMEREGILRRWSIHPTISAVPRDCWSFSAVR
jgi:[ribosomal protein S5]-alanine N-acetyltransferase